MWFPLDSVKPISWCTYGFVESAYKMYSGVVNSQQDILIRCVQRVHFSNPGQFVVNFVCIFVYVVWCQSILYQIIADSRIVDNRKWVRRVFLWFYLIFHYNSYVYMTKQQQLSADREKIHAQNKKSFVHFFGIIDIKTLRESWLILLQNHDYFFYSLLIM